MTPESQAIVDGIVAQSVVTLMESRGLAVTQAAAERPARFTIAGLAGFTGESIRGTLMIASTFDLFAQTRPEELERSKLSPEDPSDWLLLRDWAAELANQLLGRITNQLFAYGLSLRVSTPTALSGADLAVATPSSKRTRPVVFTAGNDDIWVWWDALSHAELTLALTGDEAAKEGDVILF